MTDDYKITVIIPVYNQEDLIIRAIESVPWDYMPELIVIDDGSTDNTNQVVRKWIEENSHKDIKFLVNLQNIGVAKTINRGYDAATGDYIVLLGSDDYFYHDEIRQVIGLLNGEDLVYFNMVDNNGQVFELTPENREGYPGSVKFMKRDFIGSLRNGDHKAGEDWMMMQQMVKKNPSERYTGIIAKHYNFPREGSLTDQLFKGQIASPVPEDNRPY